MKSDLIHSYCLSENELDNFVEILFKEINYPQIILFEADLGGGKTTLIRRLIQKFDNDLLIKSPTFNIVNEYLLNNKKIYHFDLYRIQNVDELEEIGFFEYIQNGDLIFIEWPQMALKFLKKYLTIEINFKENKREYLVYKN